MDNTNKIKEILDIGIDTVNNNGWSALMLAIERNNTELVLLLLEHNPNINLINKDGWTILMLAIRYLRRDALTVVKILLERSADINIIGNTGTTALSLALYGRNTELILLLLKYNPHISYNSMFLINAAYDNIDTKVIKILLKHCDINKRDSYNSTALMQSIERHNIVTMQLLLEHNADVNIVDRDNDTALTLAIQKLNDEGVEILLNSKNINAKYNNQTVLFQAVKNKKIGIIKLLLRPVHNFDINMQDNYGNTVLLYAVKDYCIETIKTLLDYRPDINICNNDGDNALMLAKNTKVLLLLLRPFHNANLSIKDSHDNSILMCLLKKYGYAESIKAAKLLIYSNLNLDINIINDSKETALTLTVKNNSYIEIVKMLLNRNAVLTNLELESAITNGNMKAVKLLLKYNPSYYSVLKKISLEPIINKNYTKIAKLLLEYGANPNTKDWSSFIIENRNSKMITLLLEYDVCYKNYNITLLNIKN